MAFNRLWLLASCCLLVLPNAGNARSSDGDRVESPASVAKDIRALFPTPVKVEERKGYIDLSSGIEVVRPASDASAARIADIIDKWTAPHFPSTTAAGARKPRLQFRRVVGMAPESYRLDIGADGVTITASDDSGLFYGGISFWQLVTASDGQSIAAQSITDAPALPWRGAMLDSARHFQSPQYVRSFIDWMAAHKLNRFHWHLVDDQGWRIEIKAFPKLTDVAATRVPASVPGAPPLPAYGGFYTQQELREIVAYAADRGIEITPEIGVPGHALSAIRAYPEWGMGVPIPPGTEAHWGVFPWLYNSDDATLTALETILAEVIDIFPGRYIHIGGDEAVKDQWRASTATQAKIKHLGLKDEAALQGWVMGRLSRFLERHGRKAIGWDEILESDVPQSVTIMSWRGIGGAVEAAKKGHDAILSPSPQLYLDHIQTLDANDPPGRGGVISLASILAFEPHPAELSVDERRHILGVQANLWTEHVRTEDRTSFMAFPRLSAIAEVGWTGHGSTDYTAFLQRLMPQIDRLRPLGLNPAPSGWTPTIHVESTKDRRTASVMLSSQGGLAQQYAVDGQPARPYTASFTVTMPAEIQAWSMLDGRRLGAGITRNITPETASRRDSRALSTCQSKVDLVLEDDFPADGPRAKFLIDILAPCWIYKNADLSEIAGVEVTVGQIPFNFQVGKDRDAIEFRAPVNPGGEIEMRLDDCDGPVIATLPLTKAWDNPGVTTLRAPVAPSAGRHDLCLTYTANSPDPLWAIDTINLLRREQK